LSPVLFRTDAPVGTFTWGRRGASALHLTRDERLDGRACGLVVALLRRGLHEVGGGGQQGAADAAVQGDPRRADRVNDDARRVRRVPHLELVLQVERDVAEGLALEADVGPLAVVEPLDVVAGADDRK